MRAVPTSLQHPSRRISSQRHAPIPSGSVLAQRRIAGSRSAPFLPVVQAKLRIGPPNDKYEQEADHDADETLGMPTRSSSSHAPVADEIDLPEDEGATTTFFPHGDSSAGVTDGEQQQSSPTCFEPSGPMIKVTSGKLHGKLPNGSDLTMLDYFPDLVTKRYLHNIRNAGLFNTGKHVGANVQLYGTIPSVCTPELFSLRQTVTYTVNKDDGVSTATEGTSVDDIQASGRDPSKAPYRQDWLDDDGYHISMADIPSYGVRGAAFPSSTNIEWVKDYVTSLVGSAGETSVNWSHRLKIEDGKVIENKVT